MKGDSVFASVRDANERWVGVSTTDAPRSPREAEQDEREHGCPHGYASPINCGLCTGVSS